MNKQSGFVSKKINGKDVGFKFGTNAFALVSEMRGVELDELDKVLGSVSGIRDLIYCAAKAHLLAKGEDVYFNEFTVGDWLDDMAQKDYEDIIGALDHTKVLGNKLTPDEEKKV